LLIAIRLVAVFGVSNSAFSGKNQYAHFQQQWKIDWNTHHFAGNNQRQRSTGRNQETRQPPESVNQNGFKIHQPSYR